MKICKKCGEKYKTKKCNSCFAIYMREYHAKHPDKLKLQHKKTYQKHKEAYVARCKKWRAKNPEREKKNGRELMAKYRAENPKFRLKQAIASQILTMTSSSKNWQKRVGYSIEELSNHLEKQFNFKMNWNNYGTYWEVDHIVPKCEFKKSEFKKCWQLSNIRPLKKEDNWKAGGLLRHRKFAK